MKILYSLKDVSLNYPQPGPDNENQIIPAICDITLDIYTDEYLVILGANGCGKSSLGKLLAGIAPNITGSIYYKGEKINIYGREVFENTTLVIQEPQNQILMPTIAKELAFPLENRGFEQDYIDSKVEEMADLFGLKELLRKNPDELSGGQITSLAIAAALITDPDTIILDEPDSHLDNKTIDIFDGFIDQYRSRKTIIVISQFPESARKADRVIILNKGQLAAGGKPDDILSDNNILAENNLKLKDKEYGLNSIKRNEPHHVISKKDSNNALLSLDDISYAYKDDEFVLKGIDLDLLTREKVALVGPSGSGKTTLGLIIAGLLQPNIGTVDINGKPLNEYLQKSRRRLVTMAMQFPERALFEETVARDIAFGPVNLGFHNTDDIIKKYLSDFQITHLQKRHPFSLSGGEKRKAALAGVLAMESQIIILDEPSAALDPGSVDELKSLLNSLNDKTVIIISHDLNFIAGICTRIISLDNGVIVGDMPAVDFFA